MLAYTLLCAALCAVASAQLAGYPYNVAALCSQYGWNGGNYPHPYDCRQFLTCNGGATFVQTCPAGLAFNPNSRQCDSYANVLTCQYQSPVNGYYPVAVNNLCGQWGWGNGNFYHPYDCSKYIQCSNGVTQVMQCPAGLFWDVSLKTCSANAINACRNYNFQLPAQPVAYPNNFNQYCSAAGLSNGIHPDPYNCLMYIECTFGVTNHMPCPAGLAFNPNILVCDDNRNVNCAAAVYVNPGKK